MVNFERFQLSNGLKVVVNEDRSTSMVAINILYNVGSRDEQPDKTGFAHLFEHLMFGGSVNVESYDSAVQVVGGETNAFTSNDITNYYIVLPSDNIETGLWLESDRMLKLNFSEERLRVQQNVVIEEYRQRYLNQPYGDIWLLLRPLAYKTHPYRWPTIGERIDHIRDATLGDVESFFYAHYAPNNAYLTLSGNINAKEAYPLVQKWFGDIEKRNIKPRNLPQEPVQNEARKQTVSRKVTSDALYKVWHIPQRMDKGFYVCDMLTDLLSSGRSARLYQTLVKEKKIFNEINAFVSGDVDPGLIILGGKVMEGVALDNANDEVEKVLQSLIENPIDDRELKKVQNRYESNLLMGQTNILSKAMELSYYEMLGDADFLNQEINKYCSIKPTDITETASKIFRNTNCSTLYYLAEK
jgi:zinc protease